MSEGFDGLAQHRFSRRQAVKGSLVALAGGAAGGALAPLAGGPLSGAMAPAAWAAGPAAAPPFQPGPTYLIPPQFPGIPVSVRPFEGKVAQSSPIKALPIPQHPFMAPNGKSNTHDDAYMSDTYAAGGPLGKTTAANPKTMAVLSSFLGGVCVSLAFDRAGRIVTACMGVIGNKSRLFLLDPDTLAPLAYLDLPSKPAVAVGDVSGQFSAGGYFYLDEQDRVVIPTTDGTIWVVAETAGPDHPRFDRKQVFDLTGILPEDSNGHPADQIQSALPDFSGRLWFVTKGASAKGSLVGTIDPRSGRVLGTSQLSGERIDNSFAVDETGGVFVASDHAMYRFDAGQKGEPSITWREEYDRGNRIKPGQAAQGTGTTPTLMGKDYVTIADNADPFMHVLVYRRAPKVSGPRLVDRHAVFGANKGCTENSLIATDTSIIVENNYGYASPFVTVGGATEPGVTRLDLDTGGLHEVWNNTEVAGPSVISKLSLASGLVYTYIHESVKDPRVGTVDAWYLVALDFKSGEIVFKCLAGTGIYFNNHYAGLYLGPDGTVYVGTLGGLVAVRDAK